MLAECAAEAGLPRQAVIDFLLGDLARQEVRTADRAAREAGVSGVPSFFLDGYSLFSGAMPADDYRERPSPRPRNFAASNRLGIGVRDPRLALRLMKSAKSIRASGITELWPDAASWLIKHVLRASRSVFSVSCLPRQASGYSGRQPEPGRHAP